MVGISDSMDMSLSKLQGDSEGQGSLVCCSPWSHKELGLIEQLNNNNLIKKYLYLNFPDGGLEAQMVGTWYDHGLEAYTNRDNKNVTPTEFF